MAEFYEVLGLDAPPKDRRDVKKAYSKKLKVTRPEDDPDGFMRLRDAHDYALKWLSWQPKAEPISDDDTPEPDNKDDDMGCLLYTSPSPRDKRQSRMPSSA